MANNDNFNEALPIRDLEQIMKWNKDLPSPQLTCAHDLIEKVSQTQPNAPAICAWNGHYTYKELDTNASLLAHHLVHLGAKRENFVPLCFEKSAFTVICMIAVLKAGAACVLLDPAHPIERNRSMIDDVKAKILLCSSMVKALWSQEPFRSLSFVEVEENLFKTLPIHASTLPLAKPEDAAIGLFTSGSTGKPKGIIQDHSTAAFSAQNCSKVFGISNGTRVLQWAAYCFDMSVIDMLMTLVGGGCICIPSEKEKTDSLVQSMRAMKVNLAAMTPSFAQTIKSDGVDSLKTLIFGGEPVSKDHLTGWTDQIRILNAYGPAEGSVCVVGPADHDLPANVGKAVGSATWIVDEADHTRLLPIGAVGELLTEGPLLARGYLNDPEKTAASFVEDLPWLIGSRKQNQNSRRVYKTGDLARYGKDGSIILMGRKDNQVKLRGQRIETAEVEHSMGSLLPAGFTAIVDVISLATRSKTQMLVAFLGARTNIHVGSDEELMSVNNVHDAGLAAHLHRIQGRLSKTLPTYMIPSYFIPLECIPLTSSGKVDRKRLRHIGSSLKSAQLRTFAGTKLDSDTVSGDLPGNTPQKQLSKIWQSTLGLAQSPSNPQDDFFELGGDSISAMKLVAMARQAGVDLTTKQVFQHRTLAAMTLAASLRKSKMNLSNGVDEPQPGVLSTHRASCSPNERSTSTEIDEIVEAPDMQAYMVVCGLLKSHGYINFFAFDLKGQIDPDRIEYACKALIDHHSILRTIFGIQGGRVIQTVLKSYTIEIRRLSRQHSPESILAAVCQTEQQCISNLGDKIVRFILVSRGQAEHTLIMRISHAQFDGTSLALIYDDLQKAYDGQTLDSVRSFADFSKIVKTENNAAAEAYWRDLLRGSTMTSIINHTKPCYANIIDEKVYLTFPFIGMRRSDITFASVVKAAWALVLAEMALSRDVVFGYAVTGREIPLHGVDKIVGDCNNAALARVIIKETDTFLDLLTRVQAQYVDAIPYQSVGLRQMVEKCTDWPRWTRYSTSVNHQNYTDAGLDTFKIGDASCKVSYKDFEVDRRDVQVYSWPPQDGQMKIALAFSNQVIPRETGKLMLEALRDVLQSMTVDIHARLTIPSKSFLHIPTEVSSIPSRQEQLPKLRHFSLSLLDPASIVSRVWDRFLTICSSDLLEGFVVTDDLPFYEFAGDLVYAAQMSAYYEAEGIELCMELLIEHATKTEQRDLLGSMLAWSD